MTIPRTDALEGALAQCLVGSLQEMAMEAEKAGDKTREHVLSQSARLLDDFRAGMLLATPHPTTGYQLVQLHSEPVAERAAA